MIHLKRFLLLMVAFLVLTLIPVRVLFRRRPWKNYAITVALCWLNTVVTFLKVLGADVNLNLTVENE